MFELIQDAGKIMVFLLILLALFLFTAKSNRQLSNTLFGSFLIITSLDISGLFINDLYLNNPWLNIFKVCSVLLQMPLYFLFVKASCFTDFKLKPSSLLHGIPFVIFLVVFGLFGQTDNTYAWFDLSATLQYYPYIIAVFISLRRYKILEQENYSFKNEVYSMLMITTVLFLVGNSMVLLRYIFENYINNGVVMTFRLANALFALVVICWFVLKTMRTPSLFLGIDSGLGENTKTEKRATTNMEAHQDGLKVLQEHMMTEKPFLDNALTLQNLASSSGLPEKELSFLINKVEGSHFFDYINSFRIEEAKELLKQEELNIQEIMYEVGFNSKSSFNTAFKKHTSQTPSSFRKSNS